MSQRYNSNVDISETQIIIWVERQFHFAQETGGKIFKFFILQKNNNKKTSTSGETQTRRLRVRITALQPLTNAPTLQYNTRLIAYNVFVLSSSICTIGNKRRIAKYNELFRRKIFRP